MDTWWQTETGGVAIAPRPSEEGAEIIAGKPMRPMLGMQVRQRELEEIHKTLEQYQTPGHL